MYYSNGYGLGAIGTAYLKFYDADDGLIFDIGYDTISYESKTFLLEEGERIVGVIVVG